MEKNSGIPIGGIPFSNIKDFDTAVSAFNMMLVMTETMIEELTKRTDIYSSMIAAFDSNNASYGGLLAALNEEQIKLQQLAVTVDKMSQATAMTAQKMLSQFQDNLQLKIDTAFKRVDDDALHRSLQATIEKSLSQLDTKSIDKAALAMSNSAAKIDKLDKMADDTLKLIQRGVKEFNETVVKSFNTKAVIASGAVCLFFGLIIGAISHSEIVNSNFIRWTVDSEHRFFHEDNEGYYIKFTPGEAKKIPGDDSHFYVKINNFKE